MRATASNVEIDGDEDGWHLIVTDDEGGRFDFNIHAISNRLLSEATDKLGPYWAEAYSVKVDYDAAREALPEGRTVIDHLERLHDEHVQHLLEARRETA